MPYLSLALPNVQIMPPWHWVGLELTWWRALYRSHLLPSGPYYNLGTSLHFLSGLNLPQLWMKREAMVRIMAIHLAMWARLVGIWVGSGCLKRIRVILFPIQPITPPKLVFPPPVFLSRMKNLHLDSCFVPLAFYGVVLNAWPHDCWVNEVGRF